MVPQPRAEEPAQSSARARGLSYSEQVDAIVRIVSTFSVGVGDGVVDGAPVVVPADEADILS